MEDYQSVLRTAELGPGAVVHVEAHGQPIALANVGQTYYAVSALCPVDGTDLAAAGRLDGDTLVCPHDQIAFDLRTGDRSDGNGAGLAAYELRVAGNEIMIGPRRSAD
jgi:nitrite reductase (NADH) small subunit